MASNLSQDFCRTVISRFYRTDSDPSFTHRNKLRQTLNKLKQCHQIILLERANRKSQNLDLVLWEKHEQMGRPVTNSISATTKKPKHSPRYLLQLEIFMIERRRGEVGMEWKSSGLQATTGTHVVAHSSWFKLGIVPMSLCLNRRASSIHAVNDMFWQGCGIDKHSQGSLIFDASPTRSILTWMSHKSSYTIRYFG